MNPARSVASSTAGSDRGGLSSFRSSVDKQLLINVLLLFSTTFALYPVTRSPDLDEVDSISFATGAITTTCGHINPIRPDMLAAFT
jgi:hypothetical protein